MISVTRSDGTVDTLTLEDYLIGVLSAEVSPQFYEEALKGASYRRAYLYGVKVTRRATPL